MVVNGSIMPVDATPRSYIKITRTWNTGDTVVLTLPMRIETRTWPRNKNSVSVKYGPIWFSLKIGEDWRKMDRGIADWPGWEVYPTTPWNYGLVLDAQAPEKSFTLVRKKEPVSDEPFTHATVPFELKTKARRIPEWTLGPEKWIAPLQMSPALTKEPVETVTLIPMAAARLRISAFPTVGSGTSAHAWTAAKLPLAGKFKVSSSFTRDSLDAANDGMEPARSNDGGVPRTTWWDHKGTAEWLQYTFDKPRTVTAVSVYWFDDTGGGECRVPASWKLLCVKAGKCEPVVLDKGQWRALEGEQHYGTKKDEYNTVRFKPVVADGLRIEVQLQPNYSAGVLEWKAGE